MGKKSERSFERSKSMEDVLEILQKEEGTTLVKLRDRGVTGYFFVGRIEKHEKKFKLDLENECLKYWNEGGKGGNKEYFIGDILDVMPGFESQITYQKDSKLSKDESDKAFALIFKLGNKTKRPNRSFLAPDKENRNAWVKGIRFLIRKREAQNIKKDHESNFRKKFQEADKNKNDYLNLEEVVVLCNMLNINIGRDEIQEKLDEINGAISKGKEQWTEDEILTVYNNISAERAQDSDIENIFKEYSKGNDRMTPSDLMEFHIKEQKEEITKEQCIEIINQFEFTEDKTSFSLKGFEEFLMLSDSMDLMYHIEQKKPEEMNHPLSHYWINTSHNTYLEGNQINGYSSTQAYVNALKQGCRCVEIDCHDGPDGEPLVYHLVSSSITFEDVVKVCSEFAFAESEYPLILSIENHCTEKQQDKMCKYLKEILGDKLFLQKIEDNETQLPSPEYLKRKILIKANPDKAPQLTELVNYIRGVSKFEKQFKKGFDNDKYNHMYSIEEYIDQYERPYYYDAKEPKKSTDMRRYNCRQMSRIYPHKSRQISSNLDPVTPWNNGCQLVALNFQTGDKENHLNRARFSANGKCGYVLKPEYLRNPEINYSPRASSGLDKIKYPGVKLIITIISGHLIPKPLEDDIHTEVVDPFVNVRIRGHEDDETPGNNKTTESVYDNGFHPTWNFKCELQVTVPELAILDLTVKDEDAIGSEYLGSAAIPVPLIPEGYRRAHLVDYAGNKLNPASLLIKVQKLPLD